MGTLGQGTAIVDNSSVRVVVVDPRRFIAEALASTVAEEPRFELSGTTSSAIAEEIAASSPDLVLVGVDHDEDRAIRLTATLRTLAPGVRIVLIADRPSPRLVNAVLEQMLGGLLLTDDTTEDMLASLRRVAHGQAILPAGWQAALAIHGSGPLDSLSDRQLEVLRLLAEGSSYEEIGHRLFISVNTVKFHTRSIFERLGVRNRTAAARVLTEATLGQGSGWSPNHPHG